MWHGHVVLGETRGRSGYRCENLGAFWRYGGKPKLFLEKKIGKF